MLVMFIIGITAVYLWMRTLKLYHLLGHHDELDILFIGHIWIVGDNWFGVVFE